MDKSFYSIFFAFLFSLCLGQSRQCFGQVVCTDSVQTIKYSSQIFLTSTLQNITTTDGGLVFIDGLSNGSPILDSFLIFKMDGNGRVVWSKLYILPTIGIWTCNVHEMNNGNLLVYVTPIASPDIDEIFIMLDKNGGILWQKGYADFGNIGLITEAPNGEIVADGLSIDDNENVYRFDASGNFIAGYTYTHLDQHGKPIWDNFNFFHVTSAINVVGNSLYMEGSIINYLPFTFVCNSVQKIDLATGKVLLTQNYQLNTTGSSSHNITGPSSTYSITGFGAMPNNRFLMVQGIATDMKYGFEYAFTQLDTSLNVVANPIDFYCLNSNAYGNFNLGATNRKGFTVLSAFDSYALIDTNNKITVQKNLNFSNRWEQSIFNLQDNGTLNIGRKEQYANGTGYKFNITNTPPEYLSGVGCSGTNSNVFGSLPLGYSLLFDSVAVSPIPLSNVGQQNFAYSFIDFKIDTLTICKQLSRCDTLKILGADTICMDGQPRSFATYKNNECLKKTAWRIADTAFASLSAQDDDSLVLNWKKPGQAYLYASIPSCGINDSLLITAIGGAIIPSKDTALCSGQQLMLHTFVYPTDKPSYQWQDGSKNSSYNVVSQGLYKVIVNIDGCTAKDSIHIIYHSNPLLSLGNDTVVCNTQEIILRPSNQSGLNYLWNNGTNADSLLIIQSGAYWVSATNQYTCSNSDTINIILSNYPQIHLGNDTALCYPDKLRLSAFSNNYNHVGYLWQDGSTNSFYNVLKQGIYRVTVDGDGCKEKDSISVVYHFKPTLNLGKDTSVCDIAEMALKASTESGLKYLWKDGSSNDSLVIVKSGSYWVFATNQYTCSSSDTINITMNQSPTIDLGNDTSLCYTQQLQLLALVDMKLKASYLWQDGSTNSQYIVTKAGVYKVTITNGCGSFTDSITITQSDCDLLVPNAFSPNNDGHNDVFRVSPYFKAKQFNLSVYNRYGKKIFESGDSNKGWDGRLNGVIQDVGTYVWLITYTDEENKRRTANGTVTLIR